MKTIILISICLCLMATVISAEKTHKHQGKLLKSGPEEHLKKTADVQDLNKNESEVKLNNPENDQVLPKPAGAGRAAEGRKHRNNHHGKNKKGANSETPHTGRSRKAHSKSNKHNGQRAHNKNGRKHGRGKQQ